MMGKARFYNKTVMPINICKTQAYFNLGTVRGRLPKACYIADDIIEDVKNCILLAGKIQSKMIRKLDVIKYDIYENVSCTWDALDEEVSEIMDNLERMLFKGEVKRKVGNIYLIDMKNC